MFFLLVIMNQVNAGLLRDDSFTYSFGGYSCHDLYNRGFVGYNSNVNITLSHEGVDEDSYTGRCTWWDNKPGTLLMQAIEGSTTFQYSASYWTTDNTLDGDGYVGFLSNNRKYDAYNSMIMTDVFTQIKNTGSYHYYWGWESVKPGTGLEIFDNHKYTWTDDGGYTGYSYYKMQKYGTTAYDSAVSSYPAFSYQSGDTIWGIGFNGRVRWGITGNQENNLLSNDTNAGIGVLNRSAGDYTNCCHNYAGNATNLYAGFELVGYDEIVIPDFSTEVELFSDGYIQSGDLTSLESNLSIWLDASNADGQSWTTDANSTHTTWVDLSGNNNNAVANTSTTLQNVKFLEVALAETGLITLPRLSK